MSMKRTELPPKEVVSWLKKLRLMPIIVQIDQTQYLVAKIPKPHNTEDLPQVEM